MFRSLLACAFILTSASASAQTDQSGAPLAPEQRAVTLDTADVAIEVFPDAQAITGVSTLNFVAKDRLDRLVVDLDDNYAVGSIAINGNELPKGSWTNCDGRMTIALAAPIAAGTRFAATIRYAGKPHVATRPPWFDGIIWEKTPQGAPWIATTAQFSGCDLYFPCIDYPTYEPQRLDLHLTVPQGLKAPSNGVLVGVDTLPDGRTTWNWRARNPTLYGVALNIAPYVELSGSYRSRYGNQIPMFYWHLPGREAQAAKLFAEFAPTLDFFESVIGPYPFADQKLGVVETPHKGMEHQTINAYGNDYAKTPFGFDDLFQHEFSHEWFANQLTVANWDDFWLHEGYGAYMQPLYGRWREGEAVYATMMHESRRGIRNRFPVVSGSPKSATDVYRPETGPAGDIYVKGAWVLHTLRNLIGDKAFFDLTRLAVYGRTDPRPGNFKPVYRTTPEYIAYARQVTGQDLQWFFDVYLYQAALPELVQTRTGDRLVVEWKAPNAKPFPLPVEISIDGNVRKLPMTGGRAVLTVPAAAHVVLDPNSRTLRKSAIIDDYQAWQAAQYRNQGN
ncbi:M1 family metallopeptidase [Sphingomonas japonica]|uniref:Aminopeptidase N n=1 Tax=Sphingomonas japonica TaxID=511662 RepID=A0ABX0U3L5_9SPHN|nr:M1 family metallopeptidase [Sphingomonas japonica]NIJ25093.1 aminopeptidase N [Sphingomonas japonica]